MKINKILNAFALSRFLSTVTIASSSVVFLSANCSGGDEMSENELEKGLIQNGFTKEDAKQAAQLLKNNGIDNNDKIVKETTDAQNKFMKIGQLLRENEKYVELNNKLNSTKDPSEKNNLNLEISDLYSKMLKGFGFSDRFVDIAKKGIVLCGSISLETIKNLIEVKNAKI